jgi:hypothetical protein
VIRTRVVISLGSQHSEHPADVLEVFIRIPAATHPFDIEFEGLVGETFVIEDGHEIP